MCDNILAYLPYVYSTFTTRELSANPLYDPDANKPWWELAWNTVVSWFASVVKWFNNLDVGWKIGIGLTLFALACIITAITAYYAGPHTAAAVWKALSAVFMEFAIGVVSAFAFTAISMAITGDFSLETLGGAVADAIFWGGVFAFISSGCNAVKSFVRKTPSGCSPKMQITEPNSAEPLTSGLTGSEIQRLQQAALTMPAGNYSVYLSLTDDYVGITKQFAVRSAAHKRNGRVVQEIIKGIDKNSARIIEQTVIDYVGRAVKNTGPLKNIINSISPTNSLYASVISFVW